MVTGLLFNVKHGQTESAFQEQKQGSQFHLQIRNTPSTESVEHLQYTDCT